MLLFRLPPHLESSLIFSISLFPSTEISSYLLFILLSFSLSYFQISFKNTHRILGNGRVGNSKGLFFHRNKENLTKMIFIRTQRLTATRWSLNQLKKKINWNTEREMCGILTYPCFIHPTQIIGGLWVPGSRINNRTDFVIKFWLSFWTSPKNSKSWLSFSLTRKSIRWKVKQFRGHSMKTSKGKGIRRCHLGQKVTLQSNNKHWNSEEKLGNLLLYK